MLTAVLFAVPLIASYLAFFVWRPEGRVNYGDLLEVRPLAEAPLRHLDGRTFRFAELRGKWVMVSIDRKSTRLNSSHIQKSRMPSSA